jgi:hypothetical protein
VCFEQKCRDGARVCREEPAHAERCRKDGRCSAGAGSCIAASAEDCKGSLRCTELGHCTPATGCCSRDGSCPPVREAAIEELLRLGDAAQRDEALHALATLHESLVAEHRGDRRGAKVVELADEIAAPLAKIAQDAAVPARTRAKALELLAATPRPAAAPALAAALKEHRPNEPGPIDGAMAAVLEAVAALRPPGVEDQVLALVRTMRASQGRSGALAYATQRAAVAMAPAGWEEELVQMLASRPTGRPTCGATPSGASAPPRSCSAACARRRRCRRCSP